VNKILIDKQNNFDLMIYLRYFERYCNCSKPNSKL